MHLTYSAIDSFSQLPATAIAGMAIDLVHADGWKQIWKDSPDLFAAYMSAWEFHGYALAVR